MHVFRAMRQNQHIIFIPFGDEKCRYYSRLSDKLVIQAGFSMLFISPVHSAIQMYAIGSCRRPSRPWLNLSQCSSVEAPYIARHTALRVGCDVGTPALTVNRLCGSGFQSIVNGAHVSSSGVRVIAAIMVLCPV